MFRESVGELGLSEEEQKRVAEALAEKVVKGRPNFKDFIKSKEGTNL